MPVIIVIIIFILLGLKVISLGWAVTFTIAVLFGLLSDFMLHKERV